VADTTAVAPPLPPPPPTRGEPDRGGVPMHALAVEDAGKGGVPMLAPTLL
jgi:hypothetical protein